MKALVMVAAAAITLTGCQVLPNHQASYQSKPHANTSPVFSEAAGLPFSEAVKVGDTLYLSGQIGLKDGKLVTGGVAAETKQIFANINHVLAKHGYQQSDLVKCVVMLTDMQDFGKFNQAYQSVLNKPYPARSTFGVSDLALGATVEIECTAVK